MREMVGTPAGLPGTGRGAGGGEVFDSASGWIEFGGLIKKEPGTLSPDGAA